MNEKKTFGYSLHLNLYNCLGSREIFHKPAFDRDNGALVLKIFIDYICNLIDVKPVYEPLVKFYGDYKENEGYSYVQLINASNITIHTVSNSKDLYLDLFSCRKFNPDKVASYAKFYFLPGEMNWDFLER